MADSSKKVDDFFSAVEAACSEGVAGGSCKQFADEYLMLSLNACGGQIENYEKENVWSVRNDLRFLYDSGLTKASTNQMKEDLQNQWPRVFNRRCYQEILGDLNTAAQYFRSDAENHMHLLFQVFGAPGIGKSTLQAVLIHYAPSIFPEVKKTGILLMKYHFETAKTPTGLKSQEYFACYAFWRPGTPEAQIFRIDPKNRLRNDGSTFASQPFFDGWLTLVDGYSQPSHFTSCLSRHVFVTSSSGAVPPGNFKYKPHKGVYILPTWTQEEMLFWRWTIKHSLIGEFGYKRGTTEAEGRYPHRWTALRKYRSEVEYLHANPHEENVKVDPVDDANIAPETPECFKASKEKIEELFPNSTDETVEKTVKKLQRIAFETMERSHLKHKRRITRFLNIHPLEMVYYMKNVGGLLRLLDSEHAFAECADLTDEDLKEEGAINFLKDEEATPAGKLSQPDKNALAEYERLFREWATKGLGKLLEAVTSNLPKVHHIWHMYATPLRDRQCPDIRDKPFLRLASQKVENLFLNVMKEKEADSRQILDTISMQFSARREQGEAGGDPGFWWENSMDLFLTLRQCAFTAHRLPDLKSTPMKYRSVAQFRNYTDRPTKEIFNAQSVLQTANAWVDPMVGVYETMALVAGGNPYGLTTIKTRPMKKTALREKENVLKPEHLSAEDNQGYVTAKYTAEVYDWSGSEEDSDMEVDEEDNSTTAEDEDMSVDPAEDRGKKSVEKSVRDDHWAKMRDTPIYVPHGHKQRQKRSEAAAQKDKDDRKALFEELRKKVQRSKERGENQHACDKRMGWNLSYFGVLELNHNFYYPFMANTYVKMYKCAQSIDGYKIVLHPKKQLEEKGGNCRDEIWLFQHSVAETHAMTAAGMLKILKGITWDLYMRLGGKVKRPKEYGSSEVEEESFDILSLVGNIHIFYMLPDTEEVQTFSESNRTSRTGFLLAYDDTWFPHPNTRVKLQSLNKVAHQREDEVLFQLWNVKSWVIRVGNISKDFADDARKRIHRMQNKTMANIFAEFRNDRDTCSSAPPGIAAASAAKVKAATGLQGPDADEQMKEAVSELTDDRICVEQGKEKYEPKGQLASSVDELNALYLNACFYDRNARAERIDKVPVLKIPRNDINQQMIDMPRLQEEQKTRQSKYEEFLVKWKKEVAKKENNEAQSSPETKKQKEEPGKIDITLWKQTDMFFTFNEGYVCKGTLNAPSTLDFQTQVPSRGGLHPDPEPAAAAVNQTASAPTLLGEEGKNADGTTRRHHWFFDKTPQAQQKQKQVHHPSSPPTQKDELSEQPKTAQGRATTSGAADNSTDQFVAGTPQAQKQKQDDRTLALPDPIEPPGPILVHGHLRPSSPPTHPTPSEDLSQPSTPQVVDSFERSITPEKKNRRRTVEVGESSAKRSDRSRDTARKRQHTTGTKGGTKGRDKAASRGKSPLHVQAKERLATMFRWGTQAKGSSSTDSTASTAKNQRTQPKGKTPKKK